MPEADPILAEHKTLGPYTLIKKLGEGGMGGVYLGRHNVLHVEHAIKIIRPRMAADPQLVERFLREARHAARLIHPNIVQVLAADVADGLYYLAMQFVPGQSLADAVAKGRLSPHRATRYIHMSALGLAYAHKKQIIHRDIKPGNILIDEDDSCKITDFGLVRDMTADDTGQNNLTQTGLIIGTPHFMPPEQWHGEGVDHRSDIYALGVTHYHLITRSYPYPGRTPPQILGLLMQGRPEPLKKFAPACDDDLCALIAKAMHVDPAQRYQSALEYAQAIDQWWTAHPPTEAESAQLALAAGEGGGTRLVSPTQLRTGPQSSAAAASGSSRESVVQPGITLVAVTPPATSAAPASATRANLTSAPAVSQATSAPVSASGTPTFTQGPVTIVQESSKTGLLVLIALIAIAALAVGAYAAFSTGKNGGNEPVSKGDTGKPPDPAPEFNLALPSTEATADAPLFTSSASFVIEGKSNVPVTLNGNPYKLGDAVTLKPKLNVLRVSARLGEDSALRELHVFLDQEAPRLVWREFDAAKSGVLPTADRSMSIAGMAADDDPQTEILCTIGNVVRPPLTVEKGGSFSIPVQVGDEPVFVELSARDRVGNKSEAKRIEIVPDRLELALNWFDLKGERTVWSPREAVSLKGKLNKQRGCTLAHEGKPVTLAADGSFTLEKTLPAGRHTVTVEASDWLKGSLKSELTVVVDLEAPKFLEFEPAAGAALLADVFPYEVKVSGRLDDAEARLKLGQDTLKLEGGRFEKTLPVSEAGDVKLEFVARDLNDRETRISHTFSVKLRRYKALGKNAQGFTEYERVSDGMIMIEVPASKFTQGVAEGLPDAPRREVELSSYLIGKFEVTNDQFARFLNARAISPADAVQQGLIARSGEGFLHLAHDGKSWMAEEGFGNFPVVNVPWKGADAYCRWADDGGGSLPSEAQWEHAARGADARVYPWGADRPNGERSVFKRSGYAGIQNVGRAAKGASPCGALDMAGNVEEWCFDWYDDTAYTRGGKDPLVKDKPSTSDRRVVRGGSFETDAATDIKPSDSDAPSDLRTFFRGRRAPASVSEFRGFRCAARSAQ